MDEVVNRLTADITPASKDLKVCHAGPDPASSLLNGFRLSPE
jgi:hypothetical protein